MGLLWVSTHSRAEAAAFTPSSSLAGDRGFNTQPRRGGCPPPEPLPEPPLVSTHSRAEAAAYTDVLYL